MSNYNAYERGEFPVGVKSSEITYQDGERTFPIEIWYPASAENIGKDLDAETQDKYAMAPGFPESPQKAIRDAQALEGQFPLIVFSHGFAGHRRQTTFLCSHLASHGYLVIAPDHVGNTLMDIMGLATKMQGEGFKNITDLFQGFIKNRPQDAAECINRMLDGSLGFSADPNSIGICGHSFGGWTSLATAIQDSRIKAIVPLAPAGGKSSHSIASGIDFSLENFVFENETPCLYLVADKDTLLPLDSMHDLYGNTPEPKRMLVLENSDHFHFCDNVEFIHDAMIKMGSGLFGDNNDTGILSKMEPSKDLCPGEKAYDFIQASTLAHMDAHLKGNSDARSFLENELMNSLAEREIKVSEHS